MSEIFARKRKTKDPCEICRMHRCLCICEAIPRLELATRVILVVHKRELKRTTNTGSLALRALPNSQMFIRGEGKEALDLSGILKDNYESFILAPSKDAIELSTALNSKRAKPIQLIVPDGNWRQASKVPQRHPELRNIQHVKISTQNDSKVHLRREHFAEGLSTIEAIALALGLIEGVETGAALSRLYQAKLQATLRGRGQLGSM